MCVCRSEQSCHISHHCYNLLLAPPHPPLIDLPVSHFMALMQRTER
jgi:hypothetical protein